MSRRPSPSPAQVAAWRALADQATAGPWFPFAAMQSQEPQVVTDLARPSFTRIAEMDHGVEDYGRANAALIAEARTAIPALCAEVERLRAALDRSRAEVERWAADYPCDGLCTDSPEEDCSRHGRPPAEVWAIVTKVQAQRDVLAAELDKAARIGCGIRDSATLLAELTDRQETDG